MVLRGPRACGLRPRLWFLILVKLPVMRETLAKCVRYLLCGEIGIFGIHPQGRQLIGAAIPFAPF